jgi:octaprenyl-diphosphate synthase
VGRDCIGAVIAAIESTDAIAYTAQAAQVEADKAVAALSIIPDSPYVDALRGLAAFSIHRTY